MVNVRVPVNCPVSKDTPLTAPGVKAFGVASLVTECTIASWFTTVTVAPGGTCRSSGEKLKFEIEMVNPDWGGGAADELESPHASAAPTAAASSDVWIPRMAPSRSSVRRGSARTLRFDASGDADVTHGVLRGGRRAGERPAGAIGRPLRARRCGR